MYFHVQIVLMYTRPRQCIAVCCGVLQCVCSVLHRVAACCISARRISAAPRRALVNKTELGDSTAAYFSDDDLLLPSADQLPVPVVEIQNSCARFACPTAPALSVQLNSFFEVGLLRRPISKKTGKTWKEGIVAVYMASGPTPVTCSWLWG